MVSVEKDKKGGIMLKVQGKKFRYKKLQHLTLKLWGKKKFKKKFNWKK